MKKCAHVAILGDTHELHDLYTFQLDLLAQGTPCFMINVYKPTDSVIKSLGSDDCVLYVDLWSEWFDSARRKLLDQVSRQGCPVFILCQEHEHLKNYSEHLLSFGIPGSIYDGYYSLPYLCRIMCEMLYFS